MKKDNKLHIKFHNPNSNKETTKFLTKLVANITAEKYLNKIPTDSTNSFKFDNTRLHSYEKVL